MRRRFQSPFTIIAESARWLGYRIRSTTFWNAYLPAAIKTGTHYAELMRLHRPIGIWLLLWPALWALWLASGGHPNEELFVLFVLGVVVTRSAGCVINDYLDRDIDAHVERTRNRPLAAKRIEPLEALIVFSGLSLVALALLLALPRDSRVLALWAAGMLVTYPLFKRFFPAPQLYLGAAFSWSIPMAYSAQSGAVSRIGWLLFLAGVLWTTTYDTMYAMADRDDDMKIGVKSSAILFGDADRFMIGLMQALTLLALGFIGWDLDLGAWYFGGLSAAACLNLYQQWLIRDREPEKCIQAFANNNYFGMAIFIGIVCEYLFRY
jgi:4-hydroxybenzoate polyprenyltransferase